MTDKAAQVQLYKLQNALKRADRVRLKTHHFHTSSICSLLEEGLRVHCDDTPYAVEYIITRQNDSQCTADSSL